MTTIIPVAYPTQEDLDRLALLNVEHERDARIIKKVASLTLLLGGLLFTTLVVMGFIINGVAGIVLAVMLLPVIILGCILVGELFVLLGLMVTSLVFTFGMCS
jgi:hypothetical protein